MSRCWHALTGVLMVAIYLVGHDIGVAAMPMNHSTMHAYGQVQLNDTVAVLTAHDHESPTAAPTLYQCNPDGCENTSATEAGARLPAPVQCTWRGEKAEGCWVHNHTNLGNGLRCCNDRIPPMRILICGTCTAASCSVFMFRRRTLC